MGNTRRTVTITGLVLLVSHTAGAAQQSEPAGPAAARSFEQPTEPTPLDAIDALVFARWREARVRPARPCSDAVFVRRVHLDALGTLPTAYEVRRFLRDGRADKRRLLIDRVLRRPEFAEYQAMRWADVLRVKSEFPINLWPNAAQAYHQWIRECFDKRLGYDQFVRRMLTSSGSNFRVPQVNFYRALQGTDPEAIARGVALTFMGTRADRWPPERLAGMAGFFCRVGFKATAEWKEEIVFFDPGKARRTAVFPDGKEALIAPDQDPRQVFADWLIQPGNPWFAACAVNRVWAWLLGRGLVHEPDDLRADNPASHPEVLALLAREFVNHGCDLEHVFRLILGSQTYQLSCVPRGPPPPPELFAVYPLRRLEAEVLIDALNQITGGTERYTSAIPEPFTFLPPTHRSIALPDGSITSAFLELFGRPPRDTGLWSERNDRCSAAQRLHLLNSSHVQRKIEQGPSLRALLQSRQAPRLVVEQVYLTILSRLPTDREVEVVTAYAREGRDARTAPSDLVWALINSAEFQYRH